MIIRYISWNMLMKRLLNVLVMIIIAIVLALPPLKASATFTPAPTANFYPMFGNSSTSNFIDLNFTVSANGHPGLVGKTLGIYPYICNGPSLYSFNDCEFNTSAGTLFSFPDTNSSVSVTFHRLPLYYLGHNYVMCFVYDSSTNNGDFCGGSVNATDPDYKDINYTGSLLPVYRFWSSTKGHHFFTQSNNEKDQVINSYDDSVWKYEQVAYLTSRTEACNGSGVFRFWSNAKQGHFYTIDPVERDYIINHYSSNEWNYEGVTFCADTIKQNADEVPVYRFWSNAQQGHFYTADENEKNSIIANYPENVWKFEGIAYYAYTE